MCSVYARISDAKAIAPKIVARISKAVILALLLLLVFFMVVSLI
jgi:hypothetical protein